MRSRDDLTLDAASENIVRFGHVAWESLPRDTRWTGSGRMVLFTFDNCPDRLGVDLYVGPGPAEARRRLIDLVSAHQPPYRVSTQASREKQQWKSLLSRRVLRHEDLEDAALDDIEARIRARWSEFAVWDLPPLTAPLQAAASIAVSVANDEASGVLPTGSAIEAVRVRRQLLVTAVETRTAAIASPSCMARPSISERRPY